MKIVLLSIAVLCSQASLADSLVLGRVTKIDSMENVGCDPGEKKETKDGELESLCMSTWYRWAIDIERTIGGAKLRGRVHAARSQHQKMRDGYPETIRLFALEPIADPKQRQNLRAEFFLIDMSPQMYCMPRDPKVFGLPEAGYVSDFGREKMYCFDLPLKHER